MKQLDLFNRCNPSQCSALSCRAEPATPQAIVLIVKSLRSLRPLRAETKHPGGDYMSHAKSAENAEIIIITLIMTGLGLKLSTIAIKSY